MAVYNGKTKRRKKSYSRTSKVKYTMLTPEQRKFLEKVQRLMIHETRLSQNEITARSVVGKILRNDNYKKIDVAWIDTVIEWYKESKK